MAGKKRIQHAVLDGKRAALALVEETGVRGTCSTELRALLSTLHRALLSSLHRQARWAAPTEIPLLDS